MSLCSEDEMISSVEESAFYETTVPATSFWINIAEQFSNDNVDAEFEVDDKRAYLKWKTEAGVAPPPANTGGLLVIQILLQKVDSCNSHAPPDLCNTTAPPAFAVGARVEARWAGTCVPMSTFSNPSEPMLPRNCRRTGGKGVAAPRRRTLVAPSLRRRDTSTGGSGMD